MEGILLVDKPAEWTSHDVVAKVRGIAKQQTGNKIKVGHAGTLDPFATGLLVVLVGSFTKKAAEYSKLDKVYEATISLGQTSSTGDPEGELSQKSAHQPTSEEIQAALNKFMGKILQTPHKFSAIKVDGQRAYKLARAGKMVELEPRQVRIYELTLEKYEYPLLKIKTKVSSGTYIRSLAEDIGKELGVGAYLTDLRRTEVGNLDVKDAQQISDLQNNLKLLTN